MRKFKFPLERVLTFRRRSAERALASFQEQQQKVRDQQLHIKQLQSQVAQTRQSNQKKVALGTARPEFLQVNSALIQGLTGKIKTEQHKLRSLMTELENRKEVLVELRREQKTMELLKEKQAEAFKKEQGRREQKAMDDLVVMRSGLKGEVS